MTRWIYIQAEAPKNDLTMLSFSHTEVRADDDEEAYEFGQLHFKENPSDVSREGYVFLNDYVVELQ